MKILIQKFGGTSVSSKNSRENAIQKVLKAISDGYQPIIVVSAMGRRSDPYSTDALLNLVDENFKINNKNSLDVLMSCGELISSVVFCNELNNAGISSIPISGREAGLLTDSSFGNANILSLDNQYILKYINENKIPVIAGFQGCDEDGRITTLGRGGSDYTASLIGCSMQAVAIEIYTDVDGIMSADPRIVDNPNIIKEIGYEEIFQLADQGAKVIHPKAVEVAMENNIPLIIKNTNNDEEGTIIGHSRIYRSTTTTNILTGITHKDNRLQVKIKKYENENNEYYNSILEILAENKISIDLINILPEENIFTVDSDLENTISSLLTSYGITFSLIQNCSKISLIGRKITGVPGVMARINKALLNENIEILQTSDSYMTIWCLVSSAKLKDAINILHSEFMV